MAVPILPILRILRIQAQRWRVVEKIRSFMGRDWRQVAGDGNQGRIELVPAIEPKENEAEADGDGDGEAEAELGEDELGSLGEDEPVEDEDD